MNYRPGDKVRVRQWEAMKRKYGLVGSIIPTRLSFIVPSMQPFCGKVVTIASVDKDGVYRIKEDNGKFFWDRNMFEGYAFKYGERIKVSEDGKNWYERIYVGYIDGTKEPYRVVSQGCEKEFNAGKDFYVSCFTYAVPLDYIIHTIKIDDKIIFISEESYQNLKKALIGD